jgi:hypothetical protein
VTSAIQDISLRGCEHDGADGSGLDILRAGEIYGRTLDRHINNLRKKIESDPRNPACVLTVYGIGYKMRRP